MRFDAPKGMIFPGKHIPSAPRRLQDFGSESFFDDGFRIVGCDGAVFFAVERKESRRVSSTRRARNLRWVANADHHRDAEFFRANETCLEDEPRSRACSQYYNPIARNPKDFVDVVTGLEKIGRNKMRI